MYISELNIKNYRNFVDFKIDLNPFTLIIGENNAGKTNLLEALGLIFSQEITVFKKRTLELDDINYDTIQKFKSEVVNRSLALDDIKFPEVRIEVIMKDFNKDQQAVVGDWLINKNLTKAKLTYVFRIREGWQKKSEWLDKQRSNANANSNYQVEFPLKQYEYVIYGGMDSPNRVDFYFLKMLKMEFLDALRDAKRELMASGDYRLLYRVLNNRDENKFSDIKKHLQDLKELLQKNSELGNVKSEIKKYLNRISLQEIESDNKIDFNFSSPEISEILKKISMEYGDNPISIKRNGLGRNNLLYMSLILSHLSDQNSGSNNVYFRVVGIEEPESHLHPHLQEHLSKNIESERRQDLQLILTSHSPYIATKLNFSNTCVLFKDSNGIVQKHNLLGGLDPNSKTVRYLKKFLDATNSKMFFAKKIILVEGISEQILIPKFFELAYKKTLERCGCNVININGVSFRHFLEIIKNGFFIKCLVLTDKDNDSAKNKENRVSKLIEDYKSIKVIHIEITNTSTFEKDIIIANKSNQGKNFLCDVLKRVRPINGKAFKEKTGSNDIDVEEYFSMIGQYKSEFAFNLQEMLGQKIEDFKIPEYINRGFDFIEENDKN